MGGCHVAVVTEVPAELISQLANGLRVHVEDSELSTPICLALAKLSEHPNNSQAVGETSVIQSLPLLRARALEDELTAEAIASILRPLSIIAEVGHTR